MQNGKTTSPKLKPAGIDQLSIRAIESNAQDCRRMVSRSVDIPIVFSRASRFCVVARMNVAICSRLSRSAMIVSASCRSGVRQKITPHVLCLLVDAGEVFSDAHAAKACLLCARGEEQSSRANIGAKSAAVLSLADNAHCNSTACILRLRASVPACMRARHSSRCPGCHAATH